MWKYFEVSFALVVCLSLIATFPTAGCMPQDDSLGKNSVEEENLDSLMNLRRKQNKRDPITIEVEIPKGLHATTRELPILAVALKNVDEEKSSVRMWRQGSDGGGSPERWQIEVRDANDVVISRLCEFPIIGGGLRGLDQLAYGEKWQSKLRIADYVQIKEPGEYAVRILYLCEEVDVHARQNWLHSVNMCTSKQFMLKVEKPVPKVVELPPGSLTRSRALVAALSEQGPIRLIEGDYDTSLYAFIDPESPEGQLHRMGRDAIPGLLSALSDEKLSFHRRGWVLGRLYFLTQERDLNPFALKNNDGIVPAYDVRGNGFSAKGDGGKPNLANQRKYTQEWLKLASECWEFQEKK
jgi:hypothetical protein